MYKINDFTLLNTVNILGVQGVPGVDFPVYSTIPRTTFSCRDVDGGYYADLETDCQVKLMLLVNHVVTTYYIFILTH